MRGGVGVIVGPLIGGAIMGVIVLVLVPALPARRHPDPGGYAVECATGHRCYQLNKRVHNPTSPAEQKRCQRHGSHAVARLRQPRSSFIWHPLAVHATDPPQRRTFICAPRGTVLSAP